MPFVVEKYSTPNTIQPTIQTEVGCIKRDRPSHQATYQVAFSSVITKVKVHIYEYFRFEPITLLLWVQVVSQTVGRCNNKFHLRIPEVDNHGRGRQA